MEIKKEAVAKATVSPTDAGDQNKPTVRQIVESIVGESDWLSEEEGFCECPGRSLHTTRNSHKDCKIYLDQVPTLSCFHGSCKVMLEAANQRLRRALISGELLATRRTKLTPEEKEQLRERERKENTRKRAANSKPRILQTFCWSYEQIKRDSPVEPGQYATDHWRQLLESFQPGDVIWIGDKYSSGKPEHQSHFRTVEQWQREHVVPAQFICPAVFKPGSYSRSNENIMARRFLVIESDVLSRDEVGAVFSWARKAVGLRLRAVVDTAGKSLHAWFEDPPEQVREELKLILPELGCDPKLFTPSQPVRLPGAMRDRKHQKLIFLDREVAR